MWVGGMCQELTLLITAAERRAKSSGDLITWNNCRAASLLPWAAVTRRTSPRSLCSFSCVSPSFYEQLTKILRTKELI